MDEEYTSKYNATKPTQMLIHESVQPTKQKGEIPAKQPTTYIIWFGRGWIGGDCNGLGTAKAVQARVEFWENRESL